MEQHETRVHLVWILLISILTFEATCISQNSQQLSSLGTEFIFGVLRTNKLPDRIQLNIVSESTANVHITSPFTHLDMQLSVVNFSSVNVSGEFSVRLNGSTYRGLHIQSDVDISVHVMPFGHYDVHEGFMALPVNVLSTEYVAASYKPYFYPQFGYSELMIVGIDNDTVYNVSGSSGSSLEVKNRRLNRFETVQFLSATDLSGTVITSNKPVAAFSGSSDSQIPNGVGDHQYLVEQLIPVDLWGYKYVVPQLYPQMRYLIRIFSSSDNSTVMLYNDTHNTTHKLDKGNTLEYQGNTAPMVVISDKPVSVFQYLYETDAHAYGDPFMTTVQSVTQFRNSYSLATGPAGTQYFDNNLTVAVTLKTVDVSNILIHDKDRHRVTQFIKVGQVQDYSVLAINITYDNFYSIEHTNNKPFGLQLYGLPHEYIGFGYPVAMSFTRNDVNESSKGTETTTIPTAPTSVITTDTTSTIVQSTSPSVTTTVRTSTIVQSIAPSTATTDTTSTIVHSTAPSTTTTDTTEGNTTMCFDCTDMSHLKYCDKVQRCESNNQICFVQSYMRSLDVKLYKSGCIDKKLCQSSRHTDCLECCEGSFCNSQGCGENGINSISNRGPMCFDCTHRGEHELCRTVQLCAPDERCIVEKYKWGSDDFHYVQGCTRSCGVRKRYLRTTNGKHTRHVPSCTKCCSSDFCNNNCTETAVPAIVG